MSLLFLRIDTKYNKKKKLKLIRIINGIQKDKSDEKTHNKTNLL